MSNFKPYDQSQMFFTPIDLQKLLPEDHPVHIINTVVEKLDLNSLYHDYSHEGNPAYNPKMMIKVLFYSYYSGSMSCRKIWDNLKHRADFMFLSAGDVPNFRTVNSFRLRHLDILPDLFTQVVLLCKDLGLIGFEHLAIDGQTIKGNASHFKNKSKKGLAKSYEKTRKRLEKLLLEEITDDFPESLKNEKEEKLQNKLKKIEAMQAKLQDILKDEKEVKKKEDA